MHDAAQIVLATRARPSFATTTTKKLRARSRRMAPLVERHPSRSRPANKIRMAKRRQTRNLPFRIKPDAAARFDLFSLPRLRGRGGRGRARLSAFHRGACGSEPTPPLSFG